MDEAYSRLDLIRLKYASSLRRRGQDRRFRLRNPKVLFGLAVIPVMCFPLEVVRDYDPKVCDIIHFGQYLPHHRVEVQCGCLLRINAIEVALGWVEGHPGGCRPATQPVGIEASSSLGWMSQYTRQSSANRRTCEAMFLGRSLIYSRNNRGPMIVNCGMPDATYTSSDAAVSTTMFCCRCFRITDPFPDLPVRTVTPQLPQ